MKPWFWRRLHAGIAISVSSFTIVYAVLNIRDAALFSTALTDGFAMLGTALGIYHLGKKNGPE